MSIKSNPNPTPVTWKWCLIVVDSDSGTGHLLSTPIGYQLSAAALADSGMILEWAPDVQEDEYGGDVRLTIRSIELGGIREGQRLIRLRRRLEIAHILPWCYFGFAGQDGAYIWHGVGTVGQKRTTVVKAVCSLRVDGDGQGWILGQLPDVASALRTAEDSRIPVEWVSRRHDGVPTAFRVEGGSLSMLEGELRQRDVQVLDFEWFPLGEEVE